MSSLTGRLKEAFDAKHMSYRALEEATGIRASVLQRYITGETRKIPIDRIQALAKALGVSAAYLMGWDDEASADLSGSMPENLPNPPGVINRRDAHQVTIVPIELHPQPTENLDSIIAQLEAFRAAQNAKPAQPTLSPKEMNLLMAFRELPKRMQDKALRIIATLGDQVENL